MKGYIGKTLRVNLTTGLCHEEAIDPKTARRFVGGTGYGIEILFRELKAGVDPLGPDNKLVFATSPLTSNLVPGGGSIMVCFKSPLTGAWGESRCGGNFGPDLRKAGFDILILEGSSKKPVYLSIVDGTPSLKDAAFLQGKDVYEKTDILEKKLIHGSKKPSVMCIGQAGENLVAFASIMYRDRAAGRSGGGTVMGAKNILAIAVAGSRQAEHADAKEFMTASRTAMKTVRENEMRDGFNEFGTVGDMPDNDEEGDWPSKNWRSNNWGQGAELFEDFQKNNLVSSKQCYSGCPIGCGRVCEVKKGAYKTPKHEGAEYESISVFTAFLLNKDMDVAVHCDYLCNRWGIDTISTGALISFAMECHEHDIFTDDDLDGIDLTWGASDALPRMVQKIVFREGIGDILANGVRKAAEIIGKGSKKFAIHVKGLEGPAHDPRSGKLLGIAYGTANRGMCHIHPLEGMAYDRGKMDWGMMDHGVSDPEKYDRWDEMGKGTECALLQRGLILPDVLCTCKFMSYAGLNPDHWASMLSATTGWDMDADELIRVGERVHTLQRLFNMREGLRRQDDMLPKRVRSTPEFGTYKDNKDCVIENYDALLDEYYTACGWNLETGIPTPATIERLDLTRYMNKQNDFGLHPE
ncbi:aldehyde:ferredoxin oxidoreductase [Pseudodesulfovibrio sp. JC047]|uniref:aldehyde ferredoxin oxidoreductase family protein n=1 Tax=Pseudodesulfovibrio sp. JC047 TaxID=2683199 RepID=UPI0013D296DF|nr:aldehyde ferredoxin oxidoreductase family protein [Pseudodesulfovibrio sp. JC047]NDV19283.1 aldehyde:ferredoxin oxidoreductase [Pseudodesulfovibrio sp. JC047]